MSLLHPINLRFSICDFQFAISCAKNGLIFLTLACAALKADPVLQVPPGFAIRRVAGPPAISFPMFATLDNKRRLYVTESSGNDLYAELNDLVRNCRVSLMEDRDGDGEYEVGNVFADKLTPSMGLVWREGKLYIATTADSPFRYASV